MGGFARNRCGASGCAGSRAEASPVRRTDCSCGSARQRRLRDKACEQLKRLPLSRPCARRGTAPCVGQRPAWDSVLRSLAPGVDLHVPPRRSISGTNPEALAMSSRNETAVPSASVTTRRSSSRRAFRNCTGPVGMPPLMRRSSPSTSGSSCHRRRVEGGVFENDQIVRPMRSPSIHSPGPGCPGQLVHRSHDVGGAADVVAPVAG